MFGQVHLEQGREKAGKLATGGGLTTEKQVTGPSIKTRERKTRLPS